MLLNFLNNFCKEFNFVHILPFFPSSSDDGFAIIDYKKIDTENGDWSDFKKISDKFKVMTDLVINHCSHQIFCSTIFRKMILVQIILFIVKKNIGISKVVRPRTSDLLKPIKLKGEKGFVWCTFSHDQIDFNLKSKSFDIFLKIIKFYLDNGVKAIRLDAVAFMERNRTNCINLPETHNIIRLIRLLVENYSPNSLIITETNVPNDQNLSYFGNNNEAHCIYNFSSLLLIHAIISEVVFT